MEGSRARRDLRRELLVAALAGARAGGRRGVVLREAARVAGVSPTAAYRHFAGYDDLFGAVCQAADGELYTAMVEQMTAVGGADLQGASLAYARLRGSGRGYVLFAVRERGLFDCLASSPAPSADTPPRALHLLSDALDECLRAGMLEPRDRPGAETLAWLAVHGLATQALQGILPARGTEFEALLERTLDFVARGLRITPPSMLDNRRRFRAG